MSRASSWPLTHAAWAAAVTVLGLGVGCADSRDGGVDRRSKWELYRVPTEQMEPTFRLGQVLAVDTGFDRVEAGEVIVFHPPANAEANACAVDRKATQACPRSDEDPLPHRFIKRVVAVGTDRVVIERGRAIVDGKAEARRYPSPRRRCRLCDLPTPITIPRGQLYVLGDRRSHNSDSRDWGPIRTEWVVGKVVASP